MAAVTAPSTSTTGNYTVAWDAVDSNPNSLVLNYIVEETVGTAVETYQLPSSTLSKAFSKSTNGNYQYEVKVKKEVSNNNPFDPDSYIVVTTLGSKTVAVKKPPTVSASFSPSSISEGGSATYTWSSTHATNCSATGMSGITGTSGKKTYNASSSMSSDQVVSVNVTCSGTGGSKALTRELDISYINDTPTISAIADRNINEDNHTGNIAFTVGDEETSASALTITRSSSNTALVPTGNIQLGGSGSSRTVKVTPAANASGSTTITLQVSDGNKVASRNFKVNVAAANDAPTLSNITNKTISEDGSTGAINFTISDIETSASALTLSKSSTNTTLIPTGNISFGGSGSNRTITVVPAANFSGTSTIGVSVSDGTHVASDTFVVTVNAVNDAPTISNISNRGINEDTHTGNINFTVSDLETAAGFLIVGATSSNTSLVPSGNISLGGSGSNRTIKVTPAANASGSATIKVTVTDGSKSDDDSFVLTVNAVNDAPVISNLSNQTIQLDSSTEPQTFTISDIETTAGSLSVSASSNNATLLPSSHLTLGGSGGSRHIRATPVIGQSGAATVTVTVSDGSKTDSDSFVVTVEEPASRVIYIHTDLLGSPIGESDETGVVH